MAFGKLRRRNNLVILGLVIFWLSLHSFSDDRKPARQHKNTVGKQAAQALLDGDLIFRKGRDLVSGLILTQGKSAQFSHVGMILRQDDQIFVVHALPEDDHSISGVQIEALSVFSSFENATDIAVYRLKGINDGLREKLKHFVLQQVGKPFDNDFLMSSDEKLYCSELVFKVFAMAGVELTGAVEPIKIMLLDEAVILPDHLRRAPQFRPVFDKLIT